MMIKRGRQSPAAGCALLGAQFVAMLLKRGYLALRSKLLVVFQVIMPVLFILVLVFLNDVVRPPTALSKLRSAFELAF